MISQGKGGANTKSGLTFEGITNLTDFLNQQVGYRVDNENVYYKEEVVARIFKKYKFYKIFLTELKIEWKEIISSQLLPDNSIYVINTNTLFIIEVKFQKVAGSVDEKLQTCDFKRKQYQKLLNQKNIKVEYLYLLNKKWFGKNKYKDVLEYILSVGCGYFFDEIPIAKFNLPIPE